MRKLKLLPRLGKSNSLLKNDNQLIKASCVLILCAVLALAAAPDSALSVPKDKLGKQEKPDKAEKQANSKQQDNSKPADPPGLAKKEPTATTTKAVIVPVITTTTKAVPVPTTTTIFSEFPYEAPVKSTTTYWVGDPPWARSSPNKAVKATMTEPARAAILAETVVRDMTAKSTKTASAYSKQAGSGEAGAVGTKNKEADPSTPYANARLGKDGTEIVMSTVSTGMTGVSGAESAVSANKTKHRQRNLTKKAQAVKAATAKQQFLLVSRISWAIGLLLALALAADIAIKLYKIQ